MLGFKPGILFLGFFVIVGAVFLGSGVFIIIITPSVHYSDPIENFNERVYQWNKYKLPEFSQWSFSISYRDKIIDLHSDFSVCRVCIFDFAIHFFVATHISQTRNNFQIYFINYRPTDHSNIVYSILPNFSTRLPFILHQT